METRLDKVFELYSFSLGILPLHRYLSRIRRRASPRSLERHISCRPGVVTGEEYQRPPAYQSQLHRMHGMAFWGRTQAPLSGIASGSKQNGVGLASYFCSTLSFFGRRSARTTTAVGAWPALFPSSTRHFLFKRLRAKFGLRACASTCSQRALKIRFALAHAGDP